MVSLFWNLLGIVVVVVVVVAVFLDAAGIVAKCWIKPRKLKDYEISINY